MSTDAVRLHEGQKSHTRRRTYETWRDGPISRTLNGVPHAGHDGGSSPPDCTARASARRSAAL